MNFLKKTVWLISNFVVGTYVNGVYELTKDIVLSQQQFDALVSFAYNCGLGDIKKGKNGLAGSKLLKDVKNGVTDADIIKNDFTAWSLCNGKRLLGLWRRRMDEAEMFLFILISI